MNRPRPGMAAWVGVVGGILIYEVLAPDNELMSEAVDRAIAKHPILTRVLIFLVALHLSNLLPPRIDPFYYLAKVRR